MNEASLKKQPRSYEETAKIISEIYQMVSPELGIHFIVPNVVLAVAGMKGDADIHWATKDKKRAAKEVDVLNQHLAQYGIRMYYDNCYEKDEDDYFGLSVISLKGFEYSSSKLDAFRKSFNISTYDSSTGFDGYNRWNRDLHKALQYAVEKGELTEDGAQIYAQGINLGYPEKAIEDFERCYRTGDIHNELVEADILSAHPLAEKYHGAIPIYRYYPESAADQYIQENIAQARAVLKGFYSSAWMQKLSKSLVFIETYSREEKLWSEYLEDMYKRRDARKKKS